MIGVRDARQLADEGQRFVTDVLILGDGSEAQCSELTMVVDGRLYGFAWLPEEKRFECRCGHVVGDADADWAAYERHLAADCPGVEYE